MKKLPTLLAIAVLVPFLSTAHSSEVRAVVDLEFVKDTGITSNVLCFGDDEDNCHTWGTFYLFTAYVRKIIEGELEEERFNVIFGQHALLKKDLPNVLATLTPLEVCNQFSAQYQAVKLEWDHGL